VAMTPHAIAVALFAAFVVGGILGKAVPLWLVAVLGLAVGAAVFVFVDRYPRLPRSRYSPAQAILAGGGRVLFVPGPRSSFPRHRTRLLRRAGPRDPQGNVSAGYLRPVPWTRARGPHQPLPLSGLTWLTGPP
jgi:hypothetical protein